MDILGDRAIRATQRACEVNPSSAQWTKGFPFIVPVSALLALLLALVLALAVLVGAPKSPAWTKVVSGCALCLAILLLFPTALIVDEYDNYPGADVSTLNGPCSP
ncbi:hypothetical protein ACH35V_35855 [Actinomadura sp. 1N219]|uniref:hypothetical protein n=1 Tax=Actinomadura sp. 1N219 TaxID=3375152 RepID=UPI00379FB445